MIRCLVVAGIILAVGAAKMPVEQSILRQREALHFETPNLSLSLREQIGQLGFVAALSGFRAIVADALFIEAHVAWERTEWGRVLLLFRQVTTLQPHSTLFWDMAAWHMGWNASAAAFNDRTQPRLALRIRAQRQYFALAKELLQRGIKNNPDKPLLYEELARLYQQKYRDHERAAEYYARAAALPGAPSYDKRFAAYELSYCPGREREAYDELHRLYEMGEQERLPALIARLKFLEKQLNVPESQQIPDSKPPNR